MNPFDYVNSVNFTKEDIMEDESTYSPYMVNRALSYFPDTIFYAAEMNEKYHLDGRLQYDFLRLSIRKRKRFSKWFKAESNDDLEMIKAHYGYSNEKARQALHILTEAEVDAIRKKRKIGGKK